MYGEDTTRQQKDLNNILQINSAKSSFLPEENKVHMSTSWPFYFPLRFIIIFIPNISIIFMFSFAKHLYHPLFFNQHSVALVKHLFQWWTLLWGYGKWSTKRLVLINTGTLSSKLFFFKTMGKARMISANKFLLKGTVTAVQFILFNNFLPITRPQFLWNLK